MKKLKIAVYSVLIVLAIYYSVSSVSFGLWVGFGPGPGLLPLLLGIAMIIMCLLQLFSKEALRSEEVKVFLTKNQAVRIFLFTVSTLLTIMLMETLGFIIALALYIFWLLRFMENYTVFKAAQSALIIPIVFWVLFYVIFELPLPEGLLSIIL
jgi:putative tricarboxylic transport membrane protein